MTDDRWHPLRTALDDAAQDGSSLRFWIRDDDAIAVTPALMRLHDLCARAGAPLLLAAIPAGAEPALGRWTASRPGITVCQHGYAHHNHAAAGERACEMGGARDDGMVLADLMAGRNAMDHVFGSRWMPLLVPPWNRIRPSLLPALPHAGFSALSTFATSTSSSNAADAATLPTLDCDLDIIDWRNGRRGRDPAALCARLAALIASARATGQPIGLLTHHLVHDENAWAFLAGALPMIASHPASGFTSVAAELARR